MCKALGSTPSTAQGKRSRDDSVGVSIQPSCKQGWCAGGNFIKLQRRGAGRGRAGGYLEDCIGQTRRFPPPPCPFPSLGSFKISPGCLGTHSVDLSSLELTEFCLPLPLSPPLPSPPPPPLFFFFSFFFFSEHGEGSQEGNRGRERQRV